MNNNNNRREIPKVRKSAEDATPRPADRSVPTGVDYGPIGSVDGIRSANPPAGSRSADNSRSTAAQSASQSDRVIDASFVDSNIGVDYGPLGSPDVSRSTTPNAPRSMNTRNAGRPSESGRPTQARRPVPNGQNPAASRGQRPTGASRYDPAGVSASRTVTGRQVPVSRPVRRQSSSPRPNAADAYAADRPELTTDTINVPNQNTSTRVIPTQSRNTGTKQPEQAVTSQKKSKNDGISWHQRLHEESNNAVVSLVKAAIYLVVVLAVSTVISLTVIMVGNDVYAFVKQSEDVQVTIPEGTTLSELSNILYDAGLIKYPRVFKLYADRKTKNKDRFVSMEFMPEGYQISAEDEKDRKTAFIAGTYDLNTDMDYEDLLWSFIPAKKSGTSWVTIPEGFTTDEIIDILVEKGIGRREKYVEVINTYPFDFWFVNKLEEDGIWSVDEYQRTGKVSSGRFYRLEGYLFPDTYEFYNASSEETVIKKMLSRFAQIFTSEYRELTEQQGFTVDQLITLASMIEKEAAKANEFFDVSEVFRNRLSSPDYFPYLQSDATVLYHIHHTTGERPKRTTHEDTLLEVPFNTYTNPGLPPGPIANPSATAMLAALNPSRKGYYYFVSGPTETHFSSSQWQHDYYVQVAADEWARAAEKDSTN